MRKWFTLVSLFFFQLIVVYFFIEDVQKLVPYFPLREVVLAIEAVFACIILVIPVVDDKKARAVTDAELIDIDKDGYILSYSLPPEYKEYVPTPRTGYKRIEQSDDIMCFRKYYDH